MKTKRSINQEYYSKRLGQWDVLYTALVKACSRGFSAREIDVLKKKVLQIDAGARTN